MSDPDQMVRRFALDRACREVGPSFEYEALHRYESPARDVLFWRARFKEPATGKKWIRPILFDSERLYRLGEPPTTGKKPLYRLPEVLQATRETVLVVEGEWCAACRTWAGCHHERRRPLVQACRLESVERS